MIVPTLYHGTDAKIVRMSSNERRNYLALCNLVIDYLWQFYEPLLEHEMVDAVINGVAAKVLKTKFDILYKKKIEDCGVKNLYYNLCEKMIIVSARNNGSGRYQYGSFYLSKDKQTAKRYAYGSFAGGETGLIAYRFIEGAEIIKFQDFNPHENIIEAINRIKEFAKEGTEEPVIFELNNLDPELLLYEDGREIDWNNFLPSHYRYIGNLVLDIDKAIFL